MSIKALQDYTFYSKYAKHIPDLQRRETWKETVNRVFGMHAIKYKDEISANPELAELIEFTKKAVLQKKVLGSQRALQFGGDPILSKNERLYNCVSTHVNRPRVFQECMFLLLCGCGAGFSVQKHHIAQLPPVQSRTKGKKTHVIVDSVEGWADAVGVLISSYVTKDHPFPEYAGYEIEFDFSLIREKGAPISWGGKAPGPDGLRNSLSKSASVLDRAIGNNKGPVIPQSIDYYDIVMHCSDAVISGGIRRCLPDYYEVQMADESWKPITDVAVDDEILYQGKIYPVLNTFNNGVQDLVKINTPDGYHVSTPEHKWLMYDKESKDIVWVQAKDIIPNRHCFAKSK